jgi:hypothetical protein
MKAQEIVISGDEPPDSGGDGAGDEFCIVRVSQLWNG